MKKLMILGDSPTRETGFARVIRNLLAHWLEAGVFDEIHVWGIGYWGFPHDYPKHVKIYPAAGPQCQRWEDVENLKRFAHVLTNGDFSHCWILQDVWGLAPLGQLLRRLAKDEGLKTLLYFPVDAALEGDWMEIAGSVQTPVAYCEYGKREALRALALPNPDREHERRCRAAISRLQVVPHGVDTCFFPAKDSPETGQMRGKLTHGKIRDGDLLLVNVATHQRRKGLAQSLQILAAMNGAISGPRIFLYLHCEAVNHAEGSSLPLIASQLGLGEAVGETIFFGHESYFINGRPCASDHALNLIYNAADCLVSTSLGEGWGLPITEAMAVGTLVAAPAHTSCEEIIGHERGVLLPIFEQQDMVIGDNSRLRRRVDVGRAAEILEEVLGNAERKEQLETAARAWVMDERFQWKFIAERWLQLMEVR